MTPPLDPDAVLAWIKALERAWYDAGWFDRSHGETKDDTGTPDTDRCRAALLSALGLGEEEG